MRSLVRAPGPAQLLRRARPGVRPFLGCLLLAKTICRRRWSACSFGGEDALMRPFAASPVWICLNRASVAHARATMRAGPKPAAGVAPAGLCPDSERTNAEVFLRREFGAECDREGRRCSRCRASRGACDPRPGRCQQWQEMHALLVARTRVGVR